jgi:dihydroflavonol-4-reductase
VVIASPTCPLGSGDEYPTPTGRILLDFLRGRMPFVSRTRLNFVDVEDLAAGLFAAMQRGTAGERYILGHSNVSLNDFLKIAGTQTGLKSPRHVLPGPVILAAGLVAECVGSVVPSWGNQLCLESAVQALHSQFFRMDKAREALGWEGTTPLTSSIQHAVEWFRHQAGEGLKEWSPPTLEPHVT